MRFEGSPNIRVKAKGTSYETEIRQTISWQNIAITAYFWKGFPLSSLNNSRSASVYEFNFLNLLQKSIFLKFTTIEFLRLSYIHSDRYFS